jgi:hypothetical protein
MSPRPHLNRFVGRSLALAAVLASLLPTAAGAVVLAPKDHGPLSPVLQELSKPSLSSKPPAQQAAALGLPATGPGSLIRDGRRVLVDIRFDGGALDRLDALRGAEASVVAASGRYQAVTAGVPPGALRRVAALPGVGSVTAVPAPIVRATDCEGGSVISEGVAQINAKATREEFGLDGEGVTVGVLSDSFNKATRAVSGGPVETKAPQDVSSADLPGTTNPCPGQETPVDVLQEFEPFEPGEEAFDEGRAMLQIVHDVAPAADLAFASAFLGELAFAESIEDLARPVLSGGAGAKVIVDDVLYLGEPFFQDGTIAAAVNQVTAEGVSYLSAAGNDNLVDSAGRDFGSWEAPSFRDAGSCPAPVQGLDGFNATHCMDFAPGAGTTDTTFGITVEAGETLVLDLQWAEPWFGVGTDIDAFLLNGSGAQILEAGVENNVSGTKQPLELMFWENESSSAQTVQLVVNRYSGGNPRLKFVLVQNGGGVRGTEYPSSTGGDEVGPTVFGHSGAASAIGVGAVRFNDSTKPERYSSRGPVTHLFGEVSGTSPAPPLGSPRVIPKPDIVATDCGATTFFASQQGSTWRFCGTSAAAPHAAGAVALMMQAAEVAGGGREEPEAIRAALLQSASPVGTFGACAVGAGLVETLGAVEALVAGPGPLAPLDCAPPPSPPVEDPARPLPVPMPPPELPTPQAATPTPIRSSVPQTRILRHPRKLVRTPRARARVVFRFGSDQSDATFLCKLDRGAFRPCGARFVRRLPPSGHVLRVRARGATGLLDPTPAVFRFRIERT